jgi:hypothetical protein
MNKMITDLELLLEVHHELTEEVDDFNSHQLLKWDSDKTIWGLGSDFKHGNECWMFRGM